jgi:hypothetical protein
MARMLRILAIVTFTVWSCSAAIVHQSTFDSGAEGWSIGDFFAASFSPATGYVASGGASGGYLETTDIFGNNAFRAPSSWLGDQSQLFGGRLRFFQRAAQIDGLSFPVVVLAGSGQRLQYRDVAPGTNWTAYTVDLLAGRWEVGDVSGDPSARLATNAELREVLSSLDWFAFHADWHTGDDLIGLDEVSIDAPGLDGPDDPDGPGGDTTVPEPASLSIVGLGVIVIAALRRRRQ